MIEGVHLFTVVVLVFHPRSKKHYIYGSIGWGLYAVYLSFTLASYNFIWHIVQGLFAIRMTRKIRNTMKISFVSYIYQNSTSETVFDR